MLIQNLDLSVVQKKLQMPYELGGYEWPEQEVIEAIQDYRHFLTKALVKIHNKDKTPLQPDAVVDIVWHTHILFTQKYHVDCQTIFGEYLHHVPKI